MTKLSIITICYNDPNLERTCESIVNQTWQDFEWIVVDGGSGEETQKIFEKYKHRINTFISEPDNGIYDAYNKGIRLANGKYVLLMNSGDTFYSKYVCESISPILEKDSDVLYGLTELSYENEETRNMILQYPNKLEPTFFINQNINTQSTFIKKALFDKYDLFDTNYRVLADLNNWIKLIKSNAEFNYVPVVVAKYDMSGLSSAEKTKLLTKKEHDDIVYKNFTQQEIDNDAKMRFQKFQKKNSFAENVFSVKNSYNKKHKIITLLGVKIKIKRKNKV